MDPMKPENAGEMAEVLRAWKAAGKSREWVLYVVDQVFWEDDK